MNFSTRSRAVPRDTAESFGLASQTHKGSRLAVFWKEITFGIRYIWQRDSLRTLLLVIALFWFAHDLGGTVFSPMILARSDHNSQVLGAISSAAGIGGVTGAVVLSAWGVFCIGAIGFRLPQLH